MEITNTAITGPNLNEFTITSGGESGTISPSNSRGITVHFSPESAGNKSAFLVIESNAASSPDTVTLTGTGTASAIALSSPTLNFGNLSIGNNTSQPVQVTNNGNENLEITNATITGPNLNEFNITSGGESGTISPSNSKEITVQFSPQNTGNKIAYLVIENSAASSPDTVTLSGTGTASIVYLSMSTLNFGSLSIGNNLSQPVEIANNGNADLEIMSTIISGSGSNNFNITSGSGAGSIAPSNSKEITVQFSPQGAGSKTAYLVIESNAASSPDTVTLSGSGFNPTVQVEKDTSVTAEQSLALSIIPPPGLQPTSAWLYYRLAGESLYDSVALNLDNTVISASIAQEYITYRGAEYYISISDGQNTVTYPSSNARTNPAPIQVTVDQYTFPLSLPEMTYKMISIPIELTNPTITDVLGSAYGEYDIKHWRVLRWEQNDTSYSYVEFPQINAAFTPGTAFWLITRSGDLFKINNGLSVDSSQPYSVTLQPDWNQVSNPYAFPVSVSSISLPNNVDAPVIYDGQQYQYYQTVLQPWEGYFIYNGNNESVTIFIPPVAVDTGLPRPSARLAINEENEYLLQLSARINHPNLIDSQNFIGLLNNASDELDSLDFYEAPPIGNYLQLSIIEDKERFAGNFKLIPNSQEGQQWDLEICATIPQMEVEITLLEKGKLPDGFQQYILDRNYNTIIPVRDNFFQISLNKPFEARQLTIILGSENYAENNSNGISLVPIEFTLEQNYPNPFNPETTIRYQLGRKSYVKLNIYNSLGQRIKALVNDVQNTGQHFTIWNGLDDAGNSVASGVYIYRIEADGFNAVHKLLFIK